MLILLNGKRFSGKDAIAALVKNLKRVSIADNMKLKFMEIHPGVNLFNREEKEKWRTELTKFTTSFDIHHWINITPYTDNCIVTDIRSMQEINFLKDKFKKVMVIRINASEEARKKRGWVYQPDYDDGELETALDNFNFDLVLNNEVPEDLQKCADIIDKLVEDNKDPFFKDIGYGIRLTKDLFNGIPFCNIVPLLSDVQIRTNIVQSLAERIRNLEKQPNYVLAIESGGYALGAWLAAELNLSYAITRKPGKLPPPYIRINYSMEYRPENEMEIQADALKQGDKVIIVDDIIATGGTVTGAINLVQRCGAEAIAAVSFATLAVKTTIITDLEVPIIAYAHINGDVTTKY